MHAWPIQEGLVYTDKIRYSSKQRPEQFSSAALVMKYRTEQKERAMRKPQDPNFTSSAKLRNLLWFWSFALTMLLLWVVDLLQTVQSWVEIRFQVSTQRLELSCNFSSQGQFSNAAASVTKTTPRNSSDPILSAGQVRFPKQALKGTRDWEHIMLTTPKVHQSLFSIQIEHSDGQKVSQ